MELTLNHNLSEYYIAPTGQFIGSTGQFISSTGQFIGITANFLGLAYLLVCLGAIVDLITSNGDIIVNVTDSMHMHAPHMPLNTSHIGLLTMLSSCKSYIYYAVPLGMAFFTSFIRWFWDTFEDLSDSITYVLCRTCQVPPRYIYKFLQFVFKNVSDGGISKWFIYTMFFHSEKYTFRRMFFKTYLSDFFNTIRQPLNFSIQHYTNICNTIFQDLMSFRLHIANYMLNHSPSTLHALYNSIGILISSLTLMHGHDVAIFLTQLLNLHVAWTDIIEFAIIYYDNDIDRIVIRYPDQDLIVNDYENIINMVYEFYVVFCEALGLTPNRPWV